MANVKFILEGDAARWLSEAAKVVQSQQRMGQGFDRMAQTGGRGMRQVETAVGRVRKELGTAELAMTRMTRAAARSGSGVPRAGGIVGQAQDLSFARHVMAGRIRDDRAFDRFIRNERASMMGRAAGNLTGMEQLLARGNNSLAQTTLRSEQAAAAAQAARDRANEQAMHAGSVAYAAGGGPVGYGEDRTMRRARQTVARRVASTPGLTGRVSPEELETMAAIQAGRVRRRQQVRGEIAQGALAVGAAVGMVAQSASQELDRYADQIVQFETTMSPLYGVGSNMNRRRQIRQGTLSQAGGFGIPLDQVAQMRFTMESAASDLEPDVKAAIERAAVDFNKLQGSDMSRTALAFVGARQLASKELEAGAAGMKQLANKLGFAADVGAFEVEQVTPYISMSLAGMQGGGYGLDETLAAMAVVSKTGMRPETYATGLRNIGLLGSMAEEKLGRALPTDLGARMAELAKLETPELVDVVGRDPFVVAKVLGEQSELLTQYTRQLRGTSSRGSFVGAKLATAYADPMHATAEAIRSAKVTQETAPAFHMEKPWLSGAVEEWELRKAGADMTTSPMMSAFKMPAVWMETAMMKLSNGAPKIGTFLEAGVKKAVADARDSGNRELEGYLSLRYGALNENYYTDAAGEKSYTTEADAEEFLRLRSKGYDLNSGQFTEFKSIDAKSKAQGLAYLGKFAPRAERKGIYDQLQQLDVQNLQDFATGKAKSLRGDDASSYMSDLVEQRTKEIMDAPGALSGMEMVLPEGIAKDFLGFGGMFGVKNESYARQKAEQITMDELTGPSAGSGPSGAGGGASGRASAAGKQDQVYETASEKLLEAATKLTMVADRELSNPRLYGHRE